MYHGAKRHTIRDVVDRVKLRGIVGMSGVCGPLFHNTGYPLVLLAVWNDMYAVRERGAREDAKGISPVKSLCKAFLNTSRSCVTGALF